MSKTIGQRIRELREQRGLTQVELAKLLGCAQTTVANWENQAKRAPGKNTIAQVAQIFGITVDYLLGVEKFENTTIPCYGEVSSKGFLWPDNREHYPIKVAYDEYTPGCFALKITDSDLEPFVLPNDYGIFSKGLPKDRDIVVARFCQEQNLSVVRRWRSNEDLVTLLPTNPHSREAARLMYIAKRKGNSIEAVPYGQLVVEGILVGIKRPLGNELEDISLEVRTH